MVSIDIYEKPPEKLKIELIDSSIDFVYLMLEIWGKKYKKMTDSLKTMKEENENTLNNNLSKFLSSYARAEEKIFLFNHEEKQGDGRQVDISCFVYHQEDPSNVDDIITVFECKRLPAPAKDREKEYVTGFDKTTGGIQRFKLNCHGQKHNVSCIIGYIQKNNSDFFYKAINNWIEKLENQKDSNGLTWSKKECLSFVSKNNKTSRYKSNHGRREKEDIILHHLWIDIK